MDSKKISIDKLVKILADPDTAKDVFTETVERIQTIESLLK